MVTNPYDLRVSDPISHLLNVGVYFTYQEKAPIGAFSVIMKTDGLFAALVSTV